MKKTLSTIALIVFAVSANAQSTVEIGLTVRSTWDSVIMTNPERWRIVEVEQQTASYHLYKAGCLHQTSLIVGGIGTAATVGSYFLTTSENLGFNNRAIALPVAVGLITGVSVIVLQYLEGEHIEKAGRLLNRVHMYGSGVKVDL